MNVHVDLLDGGRERQYGQQRQFDGLVARRQREKETDASRSSTGRQGALSDVHSERQRRPAVGRKWPVKRAQLQPFQQRKPRQQRQRQWRCQREQGFTSLIHFLERDFMSLYPPISLWSVMLNNMICNINSFNIEMWIDSNGFFVDWIKGSPGRTAKQRRSEEKERFKTQTLSSPANGRADDSHPVDTGLSELSFLEMDAKAVIRTLKEEVKATKLNFF